MSEAVRQFERNFKIPENFPVNMYTLPGTRESGFKFFYNKYRNSEENFFTKLNSKETLRQALEEGDYEVRIKAVELAMQGGFDEEFKKETKEKMGYISKNQLNKITDFLYYKFPNKFFRKNFIKTGSKTILVGEIPNSPISFRGKIIIRIIGLAPFLAWKKAYDRHDIWREAGFDYVPVEPILAFELQKDLKVRVYCAVLDQTVGQINLQQDPRLKNQLRFMKIEHGHLHDDNVCVKFAVDKNGEPDYSVRPRQYVIDLDQAREI